MHLELVLDQKEKNNVIFLSRFYEKKKKRINILKAIMYII